MSSIIHKIVLRSIDAKRFVNENLGVRNIRITNSSSITSLQKEDTHLQVGFLYAVDYFPNFASIKLEGELRYTNDAYPSLPLEAKQLPPDVTKEIHAAIMRFCMPELVLVSKQLDLTAPIPMPSMDPRQAGAPQQPVKDNAYDYR